MTVHKADYDRISHLWHSVRQHLSEAELQLFDEFQQKTTPYSHLLDLGCGSGTPIDTMLSQNGYKITGIDRSNKLLDIARSSMPEQKWIHADLSTYQPETEYQGVILWDCLFYLTYAEQLDVLRTAARSLEVGGYLILTSGANHYQLPTIKRSMFNVDFYLEALSVDALIETCVHLGLVTVSQQTLNHSAGTDNPGRAGFILQKRKQT